jgi:SSS family solute:Na+ symporter
MESSAISTIDMGIIGLYFLVVVAIGLWLGRKNKSGEDLFLAGRSLGWRSIGFSLFASNISSTTLIGLAGAAYTAGIAVANYEWMAALILIFMTFYVVPFYLKTRVTTVPEFIEKRFGPGSRRYFSVITILLSIVLDTAGGLYAGSLVLKTFFPSIDITTTCVVLALIAGLYTAVGGLAAVVYTDVIQAVILIVGTSVLAVITFQRFGFSWEAATANLGEGHLSLIRPLSDPNLPWLGTLVGLPILGFYYWATNQYIVQRVLGASDLDNAQRGCVFGGMLKLLPLFIMVLPGAFASNIFTEIERSDMVFPTMVMELLPVGIVGIVLAGLMAAIMSSVDSTLNSASTLVTCDFILPFRRDLTPRQIARIGRISTVVLMIIAAVWAPNIGRFQGLFDYLQAGFSYIVPPIAAVFLMGIFTNRGGPRTGFYTLVLGHLFSAGLFVMIEVLAVFKLHFSIVAGVITLFCVLVFAALGTWAERIDVERVRGLTWQTRERTALAGLSLRPGYSSTVPVPVARQIPALGLAVVAATLITVTLFW